MNILDQRPENLAQTHHEPILRAPHTTAMQAGVGRTAGFPTGRGGAHPRVLSGALRAVLAALETYNPFAWHRVGRRLLLDVDGIAQRVLLAKPWRESSTLHITHKGQDSAAQGQEDDGLFFLSRQIITRCLQEKPGLSIYPVFRNQYHAMKLARDLGADTLYIQDLAELIQVVDNHNQAQQMVVFLNLFSGHENATSKDGANKYNGVVSYATLLNIYGGVLNEHDLRARWLAQLGLPPSTIWEVDRQVGDFLNADLLLWVQYAQNTRHDILVVDTSIATAGSRPLATDLTIGGELLRMLERDVSYLAEKGAFSRLAIETGAETGQLFTKQLVPYFTAFASSDKESYKLIQAASYAQSFYQFVRRTGLLPPDVPLTFHVVGYSGRGISSMTLRPDQEEVLEACAETYRRGKYGQLELEQAARLEAARRHVFQVIQRKTTPLFQDGKAFMQKLGQREPDARKIYLTMTPHNQEQAPADAVALLPFSFEAEGAEDAFLVNSNSSPASTLHLRYHVCMDTLDLSDELPRAEQRELLSSWRTQRRIDQRIVQDVCALSANRNAQEQIIVYIQDKGRLQRIIEAISKRQEQIGKTFTRHEHYVEIHADSSESERAFIERAEDRDRFSVVFMTSSASREQDEPAAALLRNALIHYVRDSYPLDTLLPIGSWDSRFPFLLITSQDLQALRAKTFQTGHTLMSREMNLLTLLLSDEGQSS